MGFDPQGKDSVRIGSYPGPQVQVLETDVGEL